MSPPPFFSVALLLRNRPCLVVGGGRVATRKTRKLLAAGAAPTVVSPSLSADLAELAAAGKLQVERREFRPAVDRVVDYDLVIAATDSAEVNRAVLEQCRAEHRPCCVVDAQWSEGDFIMPAIASGSSLTVAVLGAGDDHRRTCRVRDRLAPLLAYLDDAEPLLFSLAAAGLGDEDIRAAGARIRLVWGVHEFTIVERADGCDVVAAAHCAAEVADAVGLLLHGLGKIVDRRSGREAFDLLAAMEWPDLPGALQRSRALGWSADILDAWLSADNAETTTYDNLIAHAAGRRPGQSAGPDPVA